MVTSVEVVEVVVEDVAVFVADAVDETEFVLSLPPLLQAAKLNIARLHNEKRNNERVNIYNYPRKQWLWSQKTVF
jgi:hypothetical protein